MIKPLQILLLVIVIFIAVASCKKGVIANPPSLVGKWNTDKLILWTTINSRNTTKDTTVYTGSSSYIDFRNDGNGYEKIYDFSNSSYSYDTSSYSVNGTSLIVKHGVETTSWTTEILTGDSLQLYRKSTNGSATLSTELWLMLSK